MPQTASRPRLVLIVEDEALVALSVAMLVEDMGHEVVGTADSVVEAVAMAEARSPDLVLLDVNLQEGGDGVDAGRRMQAMERPPVIVFVTSYVDQETRARMQTAAPFEIVQKPYPEALLRDAVERGLNSRAA